MAKQVGRGWIWAAQFSSVPVDTLRDLYRELRLETLRAMKASPKFRTLTVGELEAHIESFMSYERTLPYREHKCSEGALRLLVLSGQYVMVQNDQTHIPPSPETLNEGGFLGGETINDTTAAHQKLNALVARFLPNLPLETVGGFS